ncbi:MAG: hypothetical protein ACXVJE_03460 [Mucilaginibacter sp.]
MKKNAFCLFCIVVCFIVVVQNALGQGSMMQTTYFQDGAPKLASLTNHYEDIDGSPYLYDGWAQGEAVLSDGKAYKNLLLKYDQINGMVIFKYALTDSAMAFEVPAVEFKFTYITNNKIHTAHFINGFAPVGDATPGTYYQILCAGKTRLLKREVKKIIKVTEFNSSAISRHIETATTYYLEKDKHPVRINNTNKAVLFALSDKADLLKQYIAANDLNVKNDEDFAKLINYYNSL